MILFAPIFACKTPSFDWRYQATGCGLAETGPAKTYSGLLLLTHNTWAFVDSASCADEILPTHSFAEAQLPSEYPRIFMKEIVAAWPGTGKNQVGRVEVEFRGRVRRGVSGFFENRQCTAQILDFVSMGNCGGKTTELSKDVPVSAYPWYNRYVQPWEKSEVKAMMRKQPASVSGLLLVLGETVRLAVGASCGQKNFQNHLMLASSFSGNLSRQIENIIRPIDNQVTRSAEVLVQGQLEDDYYDEIRLAGIVRVKNIGIQRVCESVPLGGYRGN